MFGDSKKLTDSSLPLPNLPMVKGEERMPGVSFSAYPKTNKLITALYMVTDIISAEEPLRNKLRTLGTGIISDINSAPVNLANASSKIAEIVSFLGIASAVNIISEMNCNILLAEFRALDQAIREVTHTFKPLNRNFDLAEFLKDSGSSEISSPSSSPVIGKVKVNTVSKGPTNLGVQKAGNLMQVLKKFETSGADFDVLKKERRADILNIIKIKGGSATIKDIKDKVKLGEKTLQRELVSMVKDGVLKKVGEKRWSRYFLK